MVLYPRQRKQKSHLKAWSADHANDIASCLEPLDVIISVQVQFGVCHHIWLGSQSPFDDLELSLPVPTINNAASDTKSQLEQINESG